jgi:alpha-mannosidase
LSPTVAVKEGDLTSVNKIVYYAVPHSHTDAGWYWTYEYYYGLARRILDSVTTHLINNKDKKFTWSDHSFFRKWYMENIKGNHQKEEQIKELIHSGRLDLVNGGLVQNDEAGPLLKETYTNFVEGLTFLFDEFGIRPSTAWQLDPFGFSSSTPEILKSVGIDKVVINRMSDAYKNVLRENQDLDFIWKGDGDEEIYTHTLHGHYGVDIAFFMDNRWYATNKCPNPLDDR